MTARPESRQHVCPLPGGQMGRSPEAGGHWGQGQRPRSAPLSLSHARSTVWLPGRVGVGDSGPKPAASGAGGGGACPQCWAQPQTHQALSHDPWPVACGLEGRAESPADSTLHARGCQSLHFPAQPHPQHHLSCTQAELSPPTQKPGSGLPSVWPWAGHSAKPTFLQGNGDRVLSPCCTARRGLGICPQHRHRWPLSRHPSQQLQATRQVPG